MKSVVKVFLFLFSLFLSLDYCKAQDQKIIDSLWSVIKTTQQDTTLAATYVELSEYSFSINLDTTEYLCKKSLEVVNKGLNTAKGEERRAYLDIKASALNNIGATYYQRGNIPEAIKYYTEAVVIQKTIDDKKSLGSSYNNLGAVYVHQGNIYKGLEYFEKALAIQKEAGNQMESSLALSNIGIIYQEYGEVGKALAYFEKALKIQEQLQDPKNIGVTLHNIASVYSSQGDFVKALEYYERSFKLFEKTGQKKEQATSLNNMASIYKQLGDLAKAKAYYEKSLNLNQQLGYKRGIALALTNIGNILLTEGNAVKALENYEKSRLLYQEINYKKGIAFTLLDIGNSHLKAQNYAAALDAGQKALQIAKELSNPEEIKDAAYFLQKIYQKKQNWQEAFNMNQLYMQMRDSIQNDKTKETVLKQQIKYDYEKQEALKQAEYDKERAVFKQEQRVTTYKAYFLASTLLFVCVLAVLLISRQRIKIKKQKEAHELEQQLAQNQLERNRLEKQNLESTLLLNQEKLNHITDRFREKSKLMDKMQEELDIIKIESSEEKGVKKLLTTIEEYIDPNEYWEEFITSFNLVNKSFFDQITKKYPDLTKNELRLCALIKCNLGNKEIANILSITPDSVKKSRNRLRKRLQLEVDDSLTKYIQFLN
ncbi:MAG: tetratricopeptide repeat protein [Bacteroidota bacterium]